jgi:hypothetical protein
MITPSVSAFDRSRNLTRISSRGAKPEPIKELVADQLEGKLVKIGAKIVSDGAASSS